MYHTPIFCHWRQQPEWGPTAVQNLYTSKCSFHTNLKKKQSSHKFICTQHLPCFCDAADGVADSATDGEAEKADQGEAAEAADGTVTAMLATGGLTADITYAPRPLT
jgi:hypothetical protein